MHAPRPYGRFAHQAELSAEDAAAVERLARSLTNFKRASSLEHMKMSRALPSGRMAVAVDMGGTFRILVAEPHEVPGYEFDGTATTAIPALFSGVITKAMVLANEDDSGRPEPVGLKLTEQCRRRLVGYTEDEELPPKEIALQRFVIEYDDQYKPYFLPDFTGIYRFTQYLKLRPTWFSGAMSQVMQIAGGYGQQPVPDVEETLHARWENTRMEIPERWMRLIRQELGNVRLPGYTGVPAPDGKLKLKFGFSECNVVGFDVESRPWLIKIDSEGVFAMPLPVVPATTTPSFRAYMEEVGDEEILVILDRFHGLPTGEPFPEGEALQAWRRAGVVIKVCDVADFYDHTAFYVHCGWSVNTRGTEGYNTCYSLDDTGLKHAYSYKMQLHLGAATESGMLDRSWHVDEADQPRLNDYLARLYSALQGSSARNLAIKYKLRRLTGGELLARAGNEAAAEVDYFDNLEMEPIAPHSGSVNQVASGPLYFPGIYPTAQGRFKYPNFDGTGVESHVFTIEDQPDLTVRCDTIVFGCYVGDSLHTIRYFFDEREFQKQEHSTFEDIMIVGSWEKSTTTGPTGLDGYFYTSVWDDRAERSPSETKTTLVGTDLGYGEPAWHTPPLLQRVGTLGRTRYYEHITETRTVNGHRTDMAVCIPVYARDAILYAYLDQADSESRSKSNSRGGVNDPYSYQIWTHDPIFHFLGVTNSGNKGDPPPTIGERVYLDTMVYLPSQTSDFADQGEWFGFSGQPMDVSGTVAPYTTRGATHHVGGAIIGGRAPSIEPINESSTQPGEPNGRLNLSAPVKPAVTVHRDVPHPWYWSFSPMMDAAGSPFYFYRDAVWNTIGETEYCSIEEIAGPNGQRKYWGQCGLVDHLSAHHFIGVINE